MPEARTPKPNQHVLIVDDEPNIRTTLAICLEQAKYQAVMASTLQAALEEADKRRFDLAFVDLRLGNDSGLDLVPQLLSRQPGLPIVIITAFATFDTAVEAIKRGAADYVPKPFTPAQIRHVIARIAENERICRKASLLEGQLAAEVPETNLLTQSPLMQSVLDVALKAAESEAPILLRGESGTGKGVLARAIHSKSPRAPEPFVVINCPTLSSELLASELFGHAKGAFTGAVRDQQGKVEAAEHGTLFLDEISEIAPPLQSKLLRFVQDKQFERVGESKTRTADVRIIAATNRDLAAEVQQGRFRQDLLYRLNVIEVELPPLRARPEDIAPLARRFLEFFARASGRRKHLLSPEAEAALARHSWPGNVRELRNAMERAVVLARTEVIGPEAFSREQGKADSGLDVGAGCSLPAGADCGLQVGADCSLEALERTHIQRVLALHPVLEEAAKILGIDGSTLWRKRKRYGI